MGKFLNKIPKTLQKYCSLLKTQTPTLQLGFLSHGRERLRSPKFRTMARLPLLLDRRRNKKRHQDPEPAVNFARRSPAATLDDIDRYLLENFRSLFGEDNTGGCEAEEEIAEFESDRSLRESDLKIKCWEDCGEIRDGSGNLRLTGPDCGALVSAYGSPYGDFRRSMADVAEYERGVDWEFLEGLFFGYLRMSEKKHYRFVLMAFVDLVVDLRRRCGGDGDGDGGLGRELVVR